MFLIGNYLKFYYAIKAAYPDIQLVSNCDGSAGKLDHPADLYDFHVQTCSSETSLTLFQLCIWLTMIFMDSFILQVMTCSQEPISSIAHHGLQQALRFDAIHILIGRVCSSKNNN